MKQTLKQSQLTKNIPCLQPNYVLPSVMSCVLNCQFLETDDYNTGYKYNYFVTLEMETNFQNTVTFVSVKPAIKYKVHFF